MTEPTSDSHALTVVLKFSDSATTVTIHKGTVEECADIGHRIMKAGLVDNMHIKPHNTSYTVDGGELIGTLIQYALAYLATMELKTTEQEQ